MPKEQAHVLPTTISFSYARRHDGPRADGGEAVRFLGGQPVENLRDHLGVVASSAAI